MTIGHDFIRAMNGGKKSVVGRNPPTSRFALATIPSSYASGNPTLLFDGESTQTTRQYPYVSSYVPAANDRVFVALYNHGGLILGKIGQQYPTPSQPTNLGYIHYENAFMFGAPASNEYVFLGRLPASNNGTYDHLLVEQIGSTWTTPQDMVKNWYLFSNRNGFAYFYDERGQGSQSQLLIRAYNNTDSSVDVYAYSAQGLYNAAILRITGMDLDTSDQPMPIGTITSTAPTGTIVFDSSTYALNGQPLPTWQTPNLQNGFTGWGNGFKSLSFTKTQDGVVHIEGLFGTPASPTTSETIFVLPAGYRPAAHIMVPVASANTSSLFVEIHSDGTFMTGEVNAFPANGAWIGVNTSFLAEQ